jgi:hypothetical protein
VSDADLPRAAVIGRLVDAIHLPIGRWDRDARLGFCNAPYLAWSGRAESQLLGRTLEPLYGSAAREAARDAFAAAFGGATAVYERLLTHVAGESRWYRVQVFPESDRGGGVGAVYTVAFDVHDLQTRQQQLESSVERDPVTDVLSRRAIAARIERALGDRRAGTVAVFFVDLDGFKTVNGLLGHRDGDTVLQRVALAQVTASVGYALAPADAHGVPALLQRADDAMYFAERSGKNRAAHCSAAPL